MARVLFGLSGSIAAYKALDVIRGLRRFGIEVVPILTKGAEAFVTPLSVGCLAETEAFTDSEAMSRMPHITLGRGADLLVICPASADTIAKCRWGTTDTLLTATWSAFAGPKLLVPAMHTEMYANPANQENLAWLKAHGAQILGPVSGDLACGDTGLGRMADPALVIATIRLMVNGIAASQVGEKCFASTVSGVNGIQRAKPFENSFLCSAEPNTSVARKRILITAGGTREAIDAVRYIGNHSSGQLGHALARLAAFSGADVTLITTVPLPYQVPGVSEIRVTTTAEMSAAVGQSVGAHDVVIMAAAVADFTVDKAPQKIKRDKAISLTLQPTVDILKTMPRHPGLRVIGFCLEDGDAVAVGRAKMQAKGTDVMVCNTSASFGADQRTVTILEGSDKEPEKVTGSVDDIARAILFAIS
jgi:phosphopantothenoylcysteine decarboxylase/phosphopantothenate--cysteine ligase